MKAEGTLRMRKKKRKECCEYCTFAAIMGEEEEEGKREIFRTVGVLVSKSKII